jgi:hypothetical protein
MQSSRYIPAFQRNISLPFLKLMKALCSSKTLVSHGYMVKNPDDHNVYIKMKTLNLASYDAVKLYRLCITANVWSNRPCDTAAYC